MFGILRLILAALVAASHAGLSLQGLNPGVSAVVVFYLLAGYIMHTQLGRHYSAHGGIRWFYLDRVLRIVPVYLLFMSLALLFVHLTGYRSGFMREGLSPSSLLQNALIVPLNFFMYTGIDGSLLIPPAWSLGAELQFYLLAPLLLRRRPAYFIAFAASAGVFLLAALGILNTDHFGYRLLPGVLFIFLAGAALAAAHGQGVPALRAMLPAAATGLVALALGWGSDNLTAPFLREVLIGLFLGLGLTPLLQRLPKRPWDVRLGYLAYGLFLAHFLPIWWFELHPGPAPGSAAHIGAVLLIALSLAVAAYLLVDRPQAQANEVQAAHRIQVKILLLTAHGPCAQGPAPSPACGRLTLHVRIAA